MQGKNKKLLLKLVFISAVFLSVSAVFLPNTQMDYSDVLENNGVEDSSIYWKNSRSLVILHFSIYDFSNPNNPMEFHMYKVIPDLIKFETGDMSLKDKFTNPSYYERTDANSENPMSTGLFDIAIFVFFFLGCGFFIFFNFKVFKNLHIKKSKYSIYQGLLCIGGLIFVVIYRYLSFDFYDVNNLGYTDTMTLGLGFYTLLSGGVLFFILYFLKNKFLEDKVPVNNPEN